MEPLFLSAAVKGRIRSAMRIFSVIALKEGLGKGQMASVREKPTLQIVNLKRAAPGRNADDTSRIDPESTQNPSRIAPESTQNRPRIDPESPQNLWGSPLGDPPGGSPRGDPQRFWVDSGLVLAGFLG